MSATTTPPGWPILATAAVVLLFGYGPGVVVAVVGWARDRIRAADPGDTDFGGDD